MLIPKSLNYRLGILLFIIQSIFFRKTLDLISNNPTYKEKLDLKQFEEATYAILGTEIVTSLIQAIFL